MIRKNISLYEEDMKKIGRIVEKNEGNLSAAMREIIDFVDFMLRKFGSLEEAKKLERRTKGVCLPRGMLNWFLTYTSECLLDEDAAGSIEEICAIESVSDLAEIAGIGLPVDIKVDADDDRNPSAVTIRLTGERAHTEFVAKIIACFLAENHGLAVEDVFRHTAFTTLKMKREGEGKRESEGDYKKVRDSLIKHFGERHIMVQEILNKPRFWNAMIKATAEWGDVERYKYPRIYR
uniref:Uncharacterized protein n=1 Tax=Candidatus Methanophagaceae archaeon ANME-1 ERB6 TaxID=2759912 RepID=A0A7G9YXP3_9EURY|nr:hypothetical protein HGGDFBBL_00009 [Methanosarcinales archaeon ANME-1 ERB6]